MFHSYTCKENHRALLHQKLVANAPPEAEIENHSHPISFSRVHKSKKVYDRKRRKADDKRHLSSFFLRLAYGKNTET